MRFAINLPNFGSFGDARVLADLAHEAEETGWDGVVPGKMIDGRMMRVTPDDVREIVAYVRAHRESDAPFDVAIGGATSGDDPARTNEMMAQHAEASLTWWHEGPPRLDTSLEEIPARIRQGPPRPQ